MAAEVAIRITADGKAVVAAAQQSSQALQSIGTQAEKTAASLKTTTQSSAGLDAAMKQVDKSAQAGGLKSHVADLDKVGISAKQTAAALRGVPAQFTDIVTSLQGGQAPLTVFLQQGGQLKDMFGGAGNAAKALGGYVMGMVNPLTVGAAVVGGLAFAYEKGAQESRAFENAATMSGNAVGLSASQFGAMTHSLSDMAGTRGNAAAALTEIASTGKLAGSEIKNIAEAAILMEKATGQAIGDTVAEFVKLADEPVKASLALNKQYNYLTAAIYEQIKALEDQGNKLGAAELAEKTYADALKARATTVIDNAGLMERAWRGITGAAKGAWDAMLGVGREASLQDKLDAVGKQIAKAQGPFNASAFGDGNAEARAQLQTNLQLQASLQEMVRLEKRGTEAANERGQAQKRTTDAAVEFDKLQDQFAINSKKRDKEIAIAERVGLEAGKSRKEIETVLAGIREKYKDSAPKKERIDENAKLIASVRESVAATEAELALDQKLTPVQKDIATLYEKISSSKKHYTLETLLTVDALMQEALANEDANLTREAARKATEEANKERQKSLDTLVKETATLDDQIRKQQDQNAGIGLTKEAIAALTAQRELDKASTLEALAIKELDRNLDYQQYDATMAKVAAMRQLAGEQARGGKLQTAEDEAKKAEAAWKKTADSIENTLTDSLMRSFEKGQSFAKTARDTIVNMFKTMVLRPIVSAIMAPVSGAVGSALGFSGAANAATGGTGGGGLLSNLSSANSLYGLASTGYAATLGSGVGAVFGATAGNAAIATAITGSASSATAAALAASQAAGTATAASATLASVGSSIAAAVPYVAAALAAAAIVSSLLAKKDSRIGGGYSYDFARGTAAYGGGPDKSFTGAQAPVDAINATVAGINGLLKTIGSSSSLTQYYAASETSNKGRGGVMSGGTLSNGVNFGEDSAGSNYDGTYFETSSTQSPDLATAAANFATDLKQSIIQALQAASDVPDVIKGMVAGIDIELSDSAAVDKLLGDISKVVLDVASFQQAVKTLPFAYLRDMSFDAAAGLIAAAGGIDALGGKLSSYYANFYSEEEKRGQMVKNIVAVLGAAGSSLSAADFSPGGIMDTRDEFRALVQETDESSPLFMALLNVNQVFADITPVAEAAVVSIDGVVTGISDAMKSLMSDTAGLQVELTRAQGNGTGADAAQYAIDTAGLTEAERAVFDYNAGLRVQITTLNDAAAAATALAATNQGWINQLAILTGAETDRSIALREAGDDSTRALMNQVYAQQDLKTATDAATQAAATRAVTNQGWQNQLDLLTGAETDRSIALRGAGDDSTRALMRQVYAQQDLKAASDLAAQALEQAAQSAAQAVAAIASERAGLMQQLMQAQGDTAGLRAAELAALDPSNVALKQQIYALQDATEAAQANAAAAQQAASASQSLRSAWESVTDTIFDEVRRIRGLVAGDGAMGYAQAQAEFVITTAKARAGDQDAAKLLPGLSQTLLTLAETNASTLAELQIIRARTAGSLEQTGAGLAGQYGLSVPHLATGTNYVPHDMLMVAHKGEAVVPAVYNRPAAGSDNSDRMERLVQTLTRKIEELTAVQQESTGYAKTTSESVSGRTPMVVQVINKQGVLQ